MGGGLHPERVAAQRDLVEVELQDLLLGERALDPVREHGFLQLARIAALVADQQVLDHLLRDGGGAARRPSVRHALPRRAREPAVIEAVVLEEVLVLRRQERVHEQLGIFGKGQLHPPLARVGVNGRAVVAAHIGGQRRLISTQRVHRRQVADDRQVQHQISDRAQQQQRQDHLSPPARPHAREEPADGGQVMPEAEGETGGNAGRHD